MANFLSRIFGSRKQDNSYAGQMPATSLMDVRGGKDVYNTLYNRLINRQDLGYGDNYADIHSAPTIANMRNQFQSYQIPELTSELSRTGRRRGSAGFDQIRRAYQEEGLNEGDVFNQLQMRNEDARRQDIENALTGMTNFNLNEADTLAKRANFDWNASNQAWANQAANRKADQEALGGIAEGAIRLGLAFPTGGTSLVGFSPSGGYSQDYGNIFNQLVNRSPKMGMPSGYVPMSAYGPQQPFRNVAKQPMIMKK